jgi:hypothetical protein
MTTKTSGDSSRRVSRIIFSTIQDSFTTQGLQRSRAFLQRDLTRNRAAPGVFAITIRVLSATPAETQSLFAR